jgi:hypothetical protein
LSSPSSSASSPSFLSVAFISGSPPSISLGLRPSTLGSSSVVSRALAWTLDRRREVLSQMQVFALRGGGILAVTFVRRSLVFITMME